MQQTENPIPLCYCFGYDRKHVWDDGPNPEWGVKLNVTLLFPK